MRGYARGWHENSRKWIRTTLVIIYCLFIPGSCVRRGLEAVSYEAANRNCPKLGPDFKLNGLYIEHEEQHRAIISGDVPSAWLPFTRKALPDFRWLDRTIVEQSISSIGQKLGYACGAIDLVNEHYDFRPCHQAGQSFLCQTKECKACYRIGKAFHECIVVENSCFHFHCGSANWYNARDTCRKEGGDLALIKRRNMISEFRRFWKSTYTGPCSTAWIGLSQHMWIDQEGAEPSYTFWNQNEPSENGNCSVVYTDGGEIVWRVVPCDERHLFYCSQVEKTSLSPTVETKETMQAGTANEYITNVLKEIHQQMGRLTLLEKEIQQNADRPGKYMLAELSLNGLLAVLVIIANYIIVWRNSKQAEHVILKDVILEELLLELRALLNENRGQRDIGEHNIIERNRDSNHWSQMEEENMI